METIRSGVSVENAGRLTGPKGGGRRRGTDAKKVGKIFAAGHFPRRKRNIGKTAPMATHWHQALVRLSPRRRGFHLITDDLVSGVAEALRELRVGLFHAFLQHTSASLIINENADPDVPRDLEMALGRIAPESFPYRHTAEGMDDMPAHVKAALLGTSISVPIQDGQLLLGVWQGIYLCEHRDHGGSRRVIVTLQGEKR
jgi:secondary thiamine-phosphate synthase enzyme